MLVNNFLTRVNFLKHLMRGTLYHVLAILVTAFFAIGILQWEDAHFPSVDPKPSLIPYDETMTKFASKVAVGLYVQGLPEFSIKNNHFTLDGILWFRFPVGSDSLKTIENFVIQDSFLQSGGNLIYKSPPIIKLIEKDVLVAYHIQTSFKTDLNYKHFPLAENMISIVLQNKNVTPRELCFVVDDNSLNLAPRTLVPDKDPVKTEVHAGYMQAELAAGEQGMSISYPTVVFSITFASVGMRDFFSLYFPMFILFFIALFCLIIDINDASRLSYAATAVPILVLFRMVIDACSPSVGYSTHLDFIYYLFVFLSLLILLFQTYVSLKLHYIKSSTERAQEISKKRLERVNDAVFFMLLGLLVLGIVYTLFR